MNDFTCIIYINGIKRNATHLGTQFFVDSDSLPMRRCAQHSLRPCAVGHLQAGGRVYTAGNWYSLQPDKDPT